MRGRSTAGNLRQLQPHHMKPLPYLRRIQEKTVVLGPEGAEQIELPQWGYLLGGEDDMVSLGNQQPEVSRRTMALANTIAAADDLPAVQVHPSIVRLLTFMMGGRVQLTEQEEDWGLQWVDDLTNLLQFQQQVGVRMRNTAVAAIIAHRCVGFEDFSADDAARMPTRLREAIYEFYQAEASGSTTIKTAEEQLADLEDQLGKLLPAPGSPGESTGETPTGAASDTGPATQTSPESGSSGSRSRTSSTRSSRAKRQNATA